MCEEDTCGVVAVFVPVIDHGRPVRGSVIFELCHSCPGKGSFPGFAACWAKLLILPYWEIMRRRNQHATSTGIILGEFT